MTEMEIKSAHSGACLRFSNIEGDYFHVSLKSPEYSGTVRVWAYTDANGLVGLFESLARDWRGWSDERTWSSIEGEFAIACAHDKLGHITLNVTIHQDFGGSEPWRLRASIVVDAGQLETIANNAKQFFKT